MRRTPTPEQRAVIEAEGEILVSASAGSGKTYVMIEKMISLILAGKAEVGTVLALTYTNLAAAEMKERLRVAIIARINEEKDAAARSRWKIQLSEIATADISTLHAFCANVIRRYYYRTEASADFRIADEAEAEKLRSRAVDRTFDKLLTEKSALFTRLCSIYAGSRGFSRLKETLLDAYKRLIVKADFFGFLQEIPNMYTEKSFDEVCGELYKDLYVRANGFGDRCFALKEEIQPYFEAGLFGDKHAAYLEQRIEIANAVKRAGDLFAAAEALKNGERMRKPPNKKVKDSGDAQAMALDERMGALKDELDALEKSVSELGLREEECSAFFDAGKTAAAMSELLQVFAQHYTELKRRAGVLDFSDLEHMCLELLKIPEVCEEVRARYEYVFVDEYQDINPAQERILSLVSGKNVFMVGDMKQSIYGFRGCSANFFAEKYAALEEKGRALTLNGNFRSKKNVLDAVNALFSGVMTKEVGSVDYDATSRMCVGDAVKQAGGAVRIAIVPEKEEEIIPERDVYSVADHLVPAEDEEYAEGALIASIIAEECTKTLDDDGKERRVGYGDIVVLTRNKTRKAARLLAELVRRGIPVATEAETNICDYPEVKTMIGILQYLDNGSQDIPLAAALKSAMGGLDDAELAKIRLYAGQKDSYFIACERYAHENTDELSEKLRNFFASSEHLRLLLNVKSAAEVMTWILSRTGMETSILAQPCGAERVRRIGRLIAESGDLSVADFLEKLKSGGYHIGFSENGGENAVRLMTVHASKGLEFPIVILSGMSNPFNSDDLRGLLFDDQWGFAFCAYDLEKYVNRETVLRFLVKNRIRRKRSEDEMRLLYVAVTRAKERLHLVFGKKNSFDPAKVADAGCFADFVDLEKFEDNIEPVFGSETERPATRVLLAGEPDEEAKRAVLTRYRRAYHHAEALGLPVKTSASAMLRTRTLLSVPSKEETDIVRFEEEGYESSATAEAGISYHAFLERADFLADPKEEAARLYETLTAEGMQGLDREKMEKILSMSVFSSLKGFTLSRERAFLLCVPACEIGDTAAKDEILVQGVIDLLAVRKEECIIVDYKYSSHGAERLRADYAPQLRVYAAAARRIPGVNKVSAVLVNILQGYSVNVPV